MYINMFKAAPGMWLWRLVWHTHQALRSNAQLLAAVGAVLAALVLTFWCSKRTAIASWLARVTNSMLTASDASLGSPKGVHLH